MVYLTIIFDDNHTTYEGLPILFKNGNNKMYFEDGRMKFMKDSSLGENEFLIFGYKLGFVVHIYDNNQVITTRSLVPGKHTDFSITEAQEHRKDADKTVKVAGEQLKFRAVIRLKVKPSFKLKSTFPYFKIDPLVTHFYVRVPVAFANGKKIQNVKLQMAKDGKYGVTINHTGTVLVVAG